MAKSKYTDEQKHEILKELLACNRSEYTRIGDKYSLSPETIRAWAEKFGYHTPNAKKSTISGELPLDPDSLTKMSKAMAALKPKYTKLMEIKNDITKLQARYDELEKDYLIEQKEITNNCHISM